jgi:hypothetical protein
MNKTSFGSVSNRSLRCASRLAPFVFAASALLGGCASGGSAGAGKSSGGPLVLDGARYKLLAAGGSLDGRVVEFMLRGKGLMGCLAAPGNKLRGAAGIEMGTWVFSLQEKAPNEYEGVYRAIGADGSITDKPVAVGFTGDNLGWNLESATWERQSEMNQLTPDEKSKCTKR